MFGAGGGVRDACNLADLAVTEEPEARFVSELPGSRPSCTGFRAHVVRSGSPYLQPPLRTGWKCPEVPPTGHVCAHATLSAAAESFCSGSGVFGLRFGSRSKAVHCSVAAQWPHPHPCSLPRSAWFRAGLQAPWVPAGGSERQRLQWSRQLRNRRSWLAARRK